MSTVIKIDHLYKSYLIGHLKRERYQTLRDVVAHKARGMAQRLRHPFSPNRELVQLEEFWALKDINLEIHQGERVGIIGRNGAGKSTLLKILSRITEPTKGGFMLKGRVASLLEVGTGFHPELSGRENIYLNGAVLGMTKKEIKQRFDEIVAFAEVEKFLDTPVKRYSSGMYVRLAFAVAAHLESEILIVDEVLAVGDLSFQKKCLGKMDDMTNQGRTVVFVSHNMTAILELCSRAIWINAGKIVKQGDVPLVVSHYSLDNSIPMGEVVFDPPENPNKAYLARAYVMDDNNIRPDIQYNTTFTIVLEYRIVDAVKGLRVGFKLHNARNIVVLHAATSDSLGGTEIGCFEGTHRAQVQIPGAWLSPGRYYVEIGVWSPEFGHHQHLKEGFAFEIINPTVDSIGEEILRPILKWNVE
ncbi:MAG: ABC transporter ATP-binding protein [Thermodesulfobacteriota bacterium]